MSEGYLERLRFFEQALDLLEAEDHDLAFSSFLEAASPSGAYPVNQMMEDFVETASLQSLLRVSEVLQRYPLVLENPEATKMGLLKIFNLFSRRYLESSGSSENAAQFKLQVAKAVKISDRSGVNLKGEKNHSHLHLASNSAPSPFISAVAKLQDILYSAPQQARPKDVVRLLTEISTLVQPSLVESDDLLDNDSRLPTAPSFLLNPPDTLVDVRSAIVILAQCLILLDFIDGDEKETHLLSKQISSCLRKTTVGKRLAKLYPFFASGDETWRHWKREELCKDPEPAAVVNLSSSPNSLDALKSTTVSPEILFDPLQILEELPNATESEWATARKLLLDRV